jgi:tetratricopeptide (TPR) repeat protein
VCPVRRWSLALLAFLLVAGRGATCRADDRSVDQAAITYETGRYEECVQRFEAILKPDAASAPSTQEGRSRARMYLAACLMTLKRASEADTQFEQLIRENYRYTPDRAAFSPLIFGRYLDIRERLRDEIEAKVKIDQAREEELRRLQEERERQERERQATIEAMAREQILTRKNSRMVALLPFGVGQFQNRQRTLGWTLLGAQAAFAATSMVTYFLKENIERQFSASVDEREARRLRDLAVQANYLSFGAMVVTMLGGVVHAQVTFVPEFREVRERPLPPPVPPLGPQLTGGMLRWEGRW